MGTTVLLQNGLELKFRGGYDTLGPEVFCFLMFFDNIDNLHNHTFTIRLTRNLGQFLPLALKMCFIQVPGT